MRLLSLAEALPGTAFVCKRSVASYRGRQPRSASSSFSMLVNALPSYWVAST